MLAAFLSQNHSWNPFYAGYASGMSVYICVTMYSGWVLLPIFLTLKTYISYTEDCTAITLSSNQCMMCHWPNHHIMYSLTFLHLVRAYFWNLAFPLATSAVYLVSLKTMHYFSLWLFPHLGNCNEILLNWKLINVQLINAANWF